MNRKNDESSGVQEDLKFEIAKCQAAVILEYSRGEGWKECPMALFSGNNPAQAAKVTHLLQAATNFLNSIPFQPLGDMHVIFQNR